MLNYIKAELYRNFNRKYFWVYTGIFTILSVMLNIICKVQNQSNNFNDMLIATIEMLPFAVFLIVPIIDMASAEEHKNQTIKNVVSSGMPRNTIILSKFIVSVILCFLWAVIILGIYYISGICLFGIGKGYIKLELLTLLTSVPLYIGVLAIGTFMAAAISNSTIFAFVYAGVFAITPTFIKILMALVSPQFKKIYDVLITVQFTSFKKDITTAAASKAVISGIVYTLIFLTLSLIYFRRKEIK